MKQQQHSSSSHFTSDMSASSPAATTVGGFVVVTQVIPAGGPLIDPKKTKFIQGRPEASGAVQIIIGLVVLLFGITMLPDHYSLWTQSGVFVWGALSFITAGSVTVAAGTSSSCCLVRAALGLNVIAAFASAAAVTIYSLDAYETFIHRYWSYPESSSCVLAVFCLLEFFMSISMAAFGCYALSVSTDQPTIMINQMLQPASETQQAPPTDEPPPATEAPPTYEPPPLSEDLPVYESPSVSEVNSENVKPLDYEISL